MTVYQGHAHVFKTRFNYDQNVPRYVPVRPLQMKYEPDRTQTTTRKPGILTGLVTLLCTHFFGRPFMLTCTAFPPPPGTNTHGCGTHSATFNCLNTCLALTCFENKKHLLRHTPPLHLMMSGCGRTCCASLSTVLIVIIAVLTTRIVDQSTSLSPARTGEHRHTIPMISSWNRKEHMLVKGLGF